MTKPVQTPAVLPPLRVVTWNMDHWKRDAAARKRAWSVLETIGVGVALLQETVPPKTSQAAGIVYRPIGGSRSWGNAVATFGGLSAPQEIQTVRTRYASRTFSMLGTLPGTIMVAKVPVPGVGDVTLVSVYGAIDVYAQTTMLRIVADLIPLFDSPDGQHVILGGDFNVSTSCTPETRERPRYEAVLNAVESLGLKNLGDAVKDRPAPRRNCKCRYNPCRHLSTFRGKNDVGVGGQLDYLFATEALARRCQRLWLVDDETTAGLSDHVPMCAEFAAADPLERTEWDPTTFVELLAARRGPRAGEVIEEVLAWAQRKNSELAEKGFSRAKLDRLPTSTGPSPELWIQLDLQRPKALQYTFSVRADGAVLVHFQRLRAPFDSPEARMKLLAELNEIPDVSIERRLNGNPEFPLSTLFDRDRLSRFLAIWERVIDETVKCHASEPDAVPGGVGAK
jgi:endonuclease/exonuclease/phosphatase family metal-dependent hydrolase